MAKDIYESVGERVRQERKRAGLTIEQLAELAGISSSFLAYIETRGRKASLATIQKLSKALRIPVADLFSALPSLEKDAIHDAAQQFSHIIRDKNEAEMAAILDVVKAVSKTLVKKRKS